MGSLRIEVMGTTEEGRVWRDLIGTIDTERNGELVLEKIKKNYVKGTVIAIWERKEKRLVNHMQVEGEAKEEKTRSHEKCMIQAKVADGQMDIKELEGEQPDLIQYKIGNFTNKKDAWEAMQGIATEAPKNTILELLVLDDNQHWKIEKTKQGVMKVSVGGTSADEAGDTVIPMRRKKAEVN